jgi:hypothetical protein
MIYQILYMTHRNIRYRHMNVYIVLLICLVIFPPIVSNDRFLMEVSATSSEDGDRDGDGDGNGDGDGDGNGNGNGDGNGDGDGNGNGDENSNSETENGSGSNGEDGEGADSDYAVGAGSRELGGSEVESGGLADRPDLASPLNPPDMAAPAPAAGLPGGESSSLNWDSESEGGDSESEGGDGDRFRHNAQEIATEIASLSPEEIREYPITDLSDQDIILVFRFLNPDNLVKVLLNIPQENLVEIKERLTPADFGEPLSRISGADRTQVANRLLLTSAE